MPVSDSHIAEVRKAAGLAKFRHKVTVLEGLVGKPLPSLAPASLKRRSFIRWEAPELAVKRISPALFYSKLKEHSELRLRAVAALTELTKSCARPLPPASDLSEMKLQLKQAKHGHKLTEAALVTATIKLDQLARDLQIAKQRLKRAHKAAGPTNVVRFPHRPGNGSSV